MINITSSPTNIGIYKITSPSGKVYIGQSIDITYRKYRYKHLKCKFQPKIYNSLLKYGFENHQFEIIEECSLEQLNERESYYKQQFINEFGWNKALFCEIYDRGIGGTRDEKVKEKLRKPKPEGFGQIISDIKKGKPNINGRKSKPTAGGRKPIIQFDRQMNQIEEWESGTDASNKLKINRGDITACCKGKYKTAGGYIWKYKV